jgi:cyclin G-associated kinase
LRAGLSLPTAGTFNPDQVLNLFYQICRSVQYLHNQDPPIVHRDLKLENFLISASYSIKLCDFGSATTTVFQPDNSWSANKRSLIEDEIARQTTPMYRAPEMLDLYSNYRIDTQADIWALGCVLYLLCFNKHPFEDGAKLRIINGKYQIPVADKEFADFHDLIRLTLNTDPAQRPNVNEVMFHLENIAKSRAVELSESLVFLKRTEQMMHSLYGPPATASAGSSAAAAVTPTEPHGQANWMGNASSLFKGNSLFKTIKEASSKVIDSVQR